MNVKKIRLYEERDDVTLTTYILDDSVEMLDGKKRPAVLICPGGGYLNCSDRESEPVALQFAAMGYHAFVLRYSTYNHNRRENLYEIEDNMEPKEECMYPVPIREMGKTFLIIHENADEWLVDTDKIAICGFSAGAHNCAMYSMYWKDELITNHFKEPAIKFKPAVAILAYGIGDYHLMTGESRDDETKRTMEAIQMAYFGTKKPSKETLDAASPAKLVTKDTPPMFLWSTSVDAAVPVENTTGMATALAQAGVPFEIHVFEDGIHGLSLANQSTAKVQQEIDADAGKWIGLVDAWLKKRFALPI